MDAPKPTTQADINADRLWNDWPGPTATATSTTTKEDDLKQVLVSEYSDQGSWARHYSTVRMTLGTFFLTGSIGVIYKKWDDQYDPSTVILGGTILAIGIALFLRFTWLTFRRMNDQRGIVNSYRAALKEPLGRLFPLGIWDGLVLAFGAAVFYAFVVHLWYTHTPKPPPEKVGSSPPPSHYAVAYSAVHQTHHGREAHTFLIEESKGDLWMMECAPNGAVSFNRIQRDDSLAKLPAPAPKK